MGKILVQKTKERRAFVKKAFRFFKIKERVKKAKKILLKPNLVSAEGYPTTTHPEVLRSCLEFLFQEKKKVFVADGPAFNAGFFPKLIKTHPLAKVCQEFGIALLNLNHGPFKKVKTRSFTFNIASLLLESDFIISLPVFKAHTTCLVTGALKNQYGVLAPKDKAFFHLCPWKNIHRAIAELNQVVKVDFWIVDLVESLVLAQEVRHGGRKVSVGFMLAGDDPVALDTKGFTLLKNLDPLLLNKRKEEIPQIKFFQENFPRTSST